MTTRFMINKSKAAHLVTGANAEAFAEQYLIAQGLAPLERNYRCKQGEIDLIMEQGNILVFVEVRYRKSDRYGAAAETVTSRKQSRIIAACYHYLKAQKIDRPMRLDVVAISGNNALNWIQNAFQA